MDIAQLRAIYTADTAQLDSANIRVEQGFNKVGAAAENASSKTQSAATEQTSALNKVQTAVTSLFNKYETQLAKLGGYDSELRKLNVMLSQEGVGAKIDQTTAAILREKAASVDAERAAVQLGKEQTKAASDAEKAAQRLAQEQTKAARQSAAEWSQFSSSFSTIGNAFQQLGTYMTAAITLPLVGAGVAAEHFSSDFQTSMGRVRGLTDATKEQVDAMQKSVLDLSTRGPQGAKELADGLFFVVSAGFKGDEAMKILTASSRAAAAGLGDTKTIADAVTSTLNAYKQGADGAAKVTDILTNAVTQGKVAADALAPAFGRVLPLASAAKVPFEEVAASMATMTRVGLSADESATALRASLSSLIKPSAGARDALQSIGLTAAGLKDSLASQGLLGTLQNIMGKSGGNIDVLEKIIPNIRALTGVLATAGNQSKAYKEILDEMYNSAGKTDKAFATMSQTIGFQAAQLKNVVVTGGIEIGNRISTVLSPVIQWLNERLPAAINSTIAAWDRLSTVGKIVAGTVTGIGIAIGPALAGFGLLTRAAVMIGETLGAIGTITGLEVVAPVIAGVVIGLVGLAAEVALVYAAWQTNFGGIRNITTTVWDAVKSATETAINGVLSVTREIGGGIVNWWKDNYSLIQQTVKTVSDTIKNITYGALEVILGLWKDNGLAITVFVKQSWDTVKSITSIGMQQIGNVLKVGMQVVNGDWSGAWDSLMKILKTSVTGATVLVKGMLENFAVIFTASLTAVVKYGVEFDFTLSKWIAEAVAKATYILATLPDQLIKIVPVLYRASMSVGKAIYEGVRDGLKESLGLGTTAADKFLPGNMSFDGKVKTGSTEGYQLTGQGGSGKTAWDKVNQVAGQQVLGDGTLTALSGKVDALKGGWNGVSDAINKGTLSVDAMSSAIGNTLDKQTKVKDVAKETAITFEGLLKAMQLGAMGQESGGNQTATNKRTGAAGLFQVMPENIPEWTRNTPNVGEMTVAQFKKDANAQILVFQKYMGDYLRAALKTSGGDWELAVRKAAAMWYGGPTKGETYDNPTVFKKGEPSRAEYASQVLSRTEKALGTKGASSQFDFGSFKAEVDPAKELLKSLNEEFDNMGATTKVAQVALELTRDKFRDLTQPMREQILASAQLFDNQERLKGIFGNLANMAETPVNPLDQLAKRMRELSLAQVDADLKDEKVIDAMQRYAKATDMSNESIARRIMLLRAASNISQEGTSLEQGARGLAGSVEQDKPTLNLAPPPPPPVSDWVNFWDTVTKKLTVFKAGLPSMKQMMGETFIDLPNRIGEVFSNAVSNWDGTFKGFFKSIGQGFADLMKQIAAELVKMLAIKAAIGIASALFGGGMSLSGLFPGGANAGGGILGDLGRGMGGGIAGFAGGGTINAGQIAWVGEQGRELFLPQTPGTIINQKQLGEMTGKGTTIINNNNNVHITAGRDSNLAAPKSQRQLADNLLTRLQRKQS